MGKILQRILFLESFKLVMFPIRYFCLEVKASRRPYFPVCVLAESIRVNKTIKGKEFKIAQFADDTSLFIKPEEELLKECIKCLSDFEYVSGFYINIDKTKVIKIGGWRNSTVILCPKLYLIWTNKFESLGIKYITLEMDQKFNSVWKDNYY